MNLNEYQEKAMNTLLPTADNPDYMLFGLVGEVGEIASCIAKDIRDNPEDINFELFEQHLRKELGDVLWFVAGVCHVYGWNLEDVAQLNIDKLTARQKRGTISGSGDNR